MDILRTIATLLPLALTSGLNLYATVLVAGLCIHFGWVQNTPPGLAPLGTWLVIIVAGILFLIEALADKIPFIDNLWDMIHTVIRPVGGAILAFAVLGQADPALVVVGTLVMGSVTLISHGGKASTRATLNMVSPAEGCSNIFLSTAEDVFAGGMTYLALQFPWVAFGITLVIFLAILIFAPKLLGWMFYILQALFKALKGFFVQELQPVPLAPEHLALLNGAPVYCSIPALAQSLKGASGSQGYLSQTDQALAFTYSRRFAKEQVWQVPYAHISSINFRKKGLMDILEVDTTPDQKKSLKARFTFQKDYSTLAQQFKSQLETRLAQLSQTAAPGSKWMPPLASTPTR